MRCLIQRVSNARVDIDGQVKGEIGRGALILVCAMVGDTPENVEAAARKCANLRIFPDNNGKMNRSLRDVGGAALIVSQFTLAADTRRGNRPGFSEAAAPELGKKLYEQFCRELENLDVEIATGEFGADMAVSLTNDGPVTIWLQNDTVGQE